MELPAGTLEPDEPPDQCAARELLEETGWVAEHWVLLGAFYPAPGILDERMTLFLARGITGQPPQPEPGEWIENVATPWNDAMAMIDDGTICDAKTILGLWRGARYRSCLG